MREEKALADYARDLELIVSEIDRLNRTVSQLLAFSRPSHADPRPVSLSEMIDNTVALLRNEARELGVALTGKTNSDAMLNGSQAAALREALSNLIVNAVQASSRGGEVVVEANSDLTGQGGVSAAPQLAAAATSQSEEFKLAAIDPPTRGASQRTRSPGQRFVLSVTDSGPGIPEDSQHRIFEPFYTTKARGTGLGLAIVQRRAAELDGVVELTSPVAGGRGTTFRIVFSLDGTAV
jgi:signal transduction histidine kinase